MTIDIHAPGVLQKVMDQLKLDESDMRPQKIQAALGLYNTLTIEEQTKFNERVYRLMTIGNMHRADAAYVTMESFLNMKRHEEFMKAQGKTVHEGIKSAFDKHILQVIPEKDKVEIIDQELKDKYGTLKKE